MSKKSKDKNLNINKKSIKKLIDFLKKEKSKKWEQQNGYH